MKFCYSRTGVELSGTCSGTYDDLISTYITSPNYPKKYDNVADCSWIITSLKERTIVLTFTDFETEKKYDYLAIYNGSNDEGVQLKKLSGNFLPSSISFIGKSMYLKFKSDSSGTRKGFKMSISYGEYVIQSLFRMMFLIISVTV